MNKSAGNYGFVHFTKEIFIEKLTHQEYELKGMETSLYNADSLEICRQLLAQELGQV